MQVDSQQFDLAELSSRIDQRRDDIGMSMAALAREVGVSASTIRRFGTADDAEADGVLVLVAWLGDPPEDFISESLVRGTPLPTPSTGVIRVDMDLVRQVAPQPGTSSRTTIQRLATAAQTSGRTIASLTRLV